MRESIGGAQVLMICVTILLVIIVLLSASIGYTKAFKARNAIINIIEKHAAYGDNATTVLNYAEKEIGDILDKMGYKVSAGTKRSCNNRPKAKTSAKSTNYNYCLYQYEDSNGNYYYGIETYMYFEIPLFGENDRFVFPIYGDTNLFTKYNNEIGVRR